MGIANVVGRCEKRVAYWVVRRNSDGSILIRYQVKHVYNVDEAEYGDSVCTN